VNLFFNKNLNHLNIEFGINHGLSAYGPSSITGAGYVPTSLDPLTPAGPRRVFTNSLANPAFKSLLVQWTVFLQTASPAEEIASVILPSLLRCVPPLS